MTTPSAPQGEMHDAVLDDLPSLLTGELSPAREREVADHLDGCDACRRELAVVARASAWLQDAVRLQVIPEMTDNDEATVLPPLQLPRHSWTPVRRASARRSSERSTGAPARPGRWLAAAAAVVLLVVGVLGGGIALGRASNDQQGTPVALHPLPNGVATGDAGGKARLLADGGMKLDVAGLPTTQNGEFYEVWLYDPPTGRMLAVGVLPPDGKGSYTLPKASEQGYSAVEISLEPNDGNPGHSKVSVLRGPIA
jgi:hypothetical protein